MMLKAVEFLTSKEIQYVLKEAERLIDKSLDKMYEKGEFLERYGDFIIVDKYKIDYTVTKTQIMLSITNLEIPKSYRYQEFLDLSLNRKTNEFDLKDVRYFYNAYNNVRILFADEFSELSELLYKIQHFNAVINGEIKPIQSEKEKEKMLKTMTDIKNLIEQTPESIDVQVKEKLEIIIEFNEKIEKEFKQDLEKEQQEDVNRIYQTDMIELMNRYLKLNEKNKVKFKTLLIETIDDMQSRLQQIIDQIEARYILELEKKCRVISERYNPKKTKIGQIAN